MADGTPVHGDIGVTWLELACALAWVGVGMVAWMVHGNVEQEFSASGRGCVKGVVIDTLVYLALGPVAFSWVLATMTLDIYRRVHLSDEDYHRLGHCKDKRDVCALCRRSEVTSEVER